MDSLKKYPLSIVTSCLVLAILSLFPHTTAFAIQFHWQSAPLPPLHQSLALVARKPSRKSSSAKTPISVENIRLGVHEKYTRVVFDLQRPVTFTQTRTNNPNQIIIDLERSRLQEKARATLQKETFPAGVLVSELDPQRVRVVVDLARIPKYKLLPLNNPPRLVLDVFVAKLGSVATPTPQANGTNPVPAGPPLDLNPGLNSSAETDPASRINTIMIDPGHGGKDPGAIGRNGAREKDITLNISLMLRDLLQKDLEKTVLMTREKDRFVELEDRANLANDQDADLFVSVHVNSHPKRGVKGLEIYHFGEASDRRALEVAARENGTPIENTGVGWEYLVADLLTTKKVEDSLELAWTTKQAMVRHLKRRYKIRDHGVKTAPFYVLRFTSMPSILAEIGFISNPTEESLLKTNSYQRRMAQAIFQGIKAYVKSLETASR